MLGICCTPCPVAGSDVSYISHDPNACAATDFTCMNGWTEFDNQCGCGCIHP
jgi:hypothetical protein